MTRRVRGLKWARQLAAKPRSIPTGRARGVKALGVRYERAFAEIAKPLGVEHGVWFEFEDVNGHGYCQVDFLYNDPFVGPVVMETKYTWVESGHEQMEGLYVPVVEMSWRRKDVRTIQVCRKLTTGVSARVFDSLEGALKAAEPGRRVVLQWLPGTPIGSWRDENEREKEHSEPRVRAPERTQVSHGG